MYMQTLYVPVIITLGSSKNRILDNVYYTNIYLCTYMTED